MKLSEAIRAGAKKRPQNTDGEYYRDDDDGETSSCALGAAYEGLTGKCSTESVVYLYGKWPGLKTLLKCPVDKCIFGNEVNTLYAVICHLNDFHLWTRERIADWLWEQGR